MLERIRIRDLGVIDDVTVDLAPGLNVVTGETGAGKTMVVSGLGLLLGGRADAAVVRVGADATSVEGVIDVDAEHPVRDRVSDAGGDATDEVILARTVSAAGRSRAYVGGRAAPVGVLSEVGQMLVAVHGQADQWRLRRGEEHREMLDAFGGPVLAAAANEYRRWYTRLAELDRELARVRQLERDRHLESQVLLAGAEAIEQVAPEPGEDEALREEAGRLGHAEELRLAAAAAHDALTGGEGFDDAVGVTTLIAQARDRLGQAIGHDPALAEFEPRVAEIGYLAAELGADLAGYLDGLEADPGRLEWVQQRRADLGRLTRAYGDTVDEVLAWAQRAAARLAELDGAEARLQEIETETTKAREQAAAAAARLREARLRAGDELGRAVTEELAHLAMGRAVVDVAIETTPTAGGLELPTASGERTGPVAFGAHGVDTIEIRLAANPGARPRSVAKAASGGELSRVMLALEVVTGRPRPGQVIERNAGCEGDDAAEQPGHAALVSTFVFDEVDAGVGGRAALDVGARLAALAEHAQVIVVTHLAQVAAFADRHLVVRKTDDGHITSSGVEPVEGEGRLAELARMMAGTDSPTALQHAAELRAEADALRRVSRA